MTRADILEQTKKIIYDCAPELGEMELTEETVVNTDMGIDSMGFILIICKLEALFDIRIPNRQWNKLHTLGEVIDAIEKRLSND